MNIQLIDEILAKADLLSPDEQLQVIMSLTEKANRKTSDLKSQQKWADLAGLLSYPACGKDTQIHITQARLDDDRVRRIDD